MSWLARIFRREERAQSLGPVTQRDFTLVSYFDGDAQRFGQHVNAVRLEWLSAATAAIDAIAGTLASLPAYVYFVDANGRTEDNSHPLTRLVRDGPNAHQSWPDFLQWLVAQTLRYGNGVAEKVYDSAGRLTELKPIPFDRIAIKVLETGRLTYEFTDQVTLQRRKLFNEDVLHLRDRSDDGLIGRARHERAHPVIATALALTSFCGNMYANGAFPAGVLETDGKLSQAGYDILAQSFKEAFSGASKAAKTLLLDQGIKFKNISATPEDMELLAARRYMVEECGRLYGVPSPLINEHSHSTFTNSETLMRFFAQGTISQWARKLEAEIQRSLFSDAARATRKFEIDLSGLLRGDPEQRWRSWQIALQNGVLTPNEVREIEGWNPRAGGDEVRPATAATGATTGATADVPAPSAPARPNGAVN